MLNKARFILNPTVSYVRKEIGSVGIFTLSIDNSSGKVLARERIGVCSKRKEELTADLEKVNSSIGQASLPFVKHGPKKVAG